MPAVWLRRREHTEARRDTLVKGGIEPLFKAGAPVTRLAGEPGFGGKVKQQGEVGREPTRGERDNRPQLSERQAAPVPLIRERGIGEPVGDDRGTARQRGADHLGDQPTLQHHHFAGGRRLGQRLPAEGARLRRRFARLLRGQRRLAHSARRQRRWDTSVMQITQEQAKYITGAFELVKVPEVGGIPAQRLPEVIDTVSVMLADIERHGMDAVRRYARDLDGWESDITLSSADLAKSGDSLSPLLREALQASAERTQKFEIGRAHV